MKGLYVVPILGLLVTLAHGEEFAIEKGMCNYKNPCYTSATVNATCYIDPGAPIVGPMRCRCPEGFDGDGRTDGTGCVDKDECSAYPPGHPSAPCRNPYEHCINEIGSYKCACDRGFQNRPDGAPGCLDINECEISTMNACDLRTQVCENLPGSYRCVCKNPGDVLDARTNQCRQFNVCLDAEGALNPCDKETSVCHFDRELGAQCVCKSGYEKNEVTQQCTDIDECAVDPSVCPAEVSECVNTPGSYECQCNEVAGYTAGPTKNTCIPFNECERWPAICGELPCCQDLTPAFPPVAFSGFTCAPSLSSSTYFNPFAQTPSPSPSLAASSAQRPSFKRVSSRFTAEEPLVFTASSLAGLQSRRRRLEEVAPQEALAELVTSAVPVVDAATMIFGDALKGLSRLGMPERCPRGYINTHAKLRALARERMASVVSGAILAPFQMDPAAFGQGIVENSELIASDLVKWTRALSAGPLAWARVAENLTSLWTDPDTGEGANILRSGINVGADLMKSFSGWTSLLTPQ